jgi:hypothetical protein
VVALAGSSKTPRIVGKGRVDVAFTFEEGAVFHACQALPIEQARARIDKSTRTFRKRAEDGLVAFVAKLGLHVCAAGICVKSMKPLPPLESILKSHPLVHAAEITLYRTVYTDACAAIGARPTSYSADALTKDVASALRVKPGSVTAHLAAMGRASGRPWAAEQKEAALAAWLALVAREPA